MEVGVQVPISFVEFCKRWKCVYNMEISCKQHLYGVLNGLEDTNILEVDIWLLEAAAMTNQKQKRPGRRFQQRAHCHGLACSPQ
jgi:hypothetical protein